VFDRQRVVNLRESFVVSSREGCVDLRAMKRKRVEPPGLEGAVESPSISAVGLVASASGPGEISGNFESMVAYLTGSAGIWYTSVGGNECVLKGIIRFERIHLTAVSAYLIAFAQVISMGIRAVDGPGGLTIHRESAVRGRSNKGSYLGFFCFLSCAW